MHILRAHAKYKNDSFLGKGESQNLCRAIKIGGTEFITVAP
jgi:hypothetical protein